MNNLFEKNIVIATLTGDIHDIGKNKIVSILVKNGFSVIDLGINIDCESLIESVVEHNAKIICLSVFLTLTMIEIEKIMIMLINRKLNIPVIIGGPIVTAEYASSIGAFYADADNVVEKVCGLLL